MHTRPHVRRLRFALIPLALLPLAACSGADTATSPSPSAAPEASTSAPAAASATPSSAASASPAGESGSSGAEKVIPVGKKYTDPETGDVIEVIEVVRNASPAKAKEQIAKGGEVVLMRVRVTPGDKFGGAISTNQFRLVADGDAKAATSSYKDELGPGRTSLEMVSRRDGKAAEGWVAWLAREKQDTYQFRYERGEAKIIGQDKKIPSYQEELTIGKG